MTKEHKGKMPDFIVVENTQEYIDNHSRTQKNLLKRYTFLQHPFLLRLLAFIGMVISFSIAVIFLIGCFCLALIAAFFLLQDRRMNQRVRFTWSVYTYASVIAAGCSVACFSPLLGLNALALYFIHQDILTGLSRYFLTK